MSADNDLTPYALMDLYEMEAGYESGRFVGSTNKADVLVQLDTAQTRDIKRLHMFQTPEVYDKALKKSDFLQGWTEVKVRSPVVTVIPEVAGQKQGRLLKDFLAWGLRAYPAKHTMVIVWGHGQGWGSGRRSSKTLSSRFVKASDLDLGVTDLAREAPRVPQELKGRAFGGQAFDSTDRTYLSIPELRAVLSDTKAQVLESKRNLDVYVSDACLMQMIEVAYEIAPMTDYVGGSAQIQSFLGLPYRRILYNLNSNLFGQDRVPPEPRNEAHLVAQMLPKLLKSSFKAQGLQGRHDPAAISTVTMSVLNSHELIYTLKPALNDLAQALNAWLLEDPLRAGEIEFLLQRVPGFEGGAQDLGAFTILLNALIQGEKVFEGRLSTKADALRLQALDTRSALMKSVVSASLGSRYESREKDLFLAGMRAVSMFLPATQEEADSRLEDMERSRFYREVPAWAEWIRRVYPGP
jgi:hypothetical protein